MQRFVSFLLYATIFIKQKIYPRIGVLFLGDFRDFFFSFLEILEIFSFFCYIEPKIGLTLFLILPIICRKVIL